MGGPGTRAARRLSWLVAALAAFACALGLGRRDVYLDEETFVRAGWLGNDLVTLLVAVPALAWGARYAARGTAARLVWLGTLGFMTYNYAFYLFGAEPNRLLLVYAALVSLSLLAFLLGLLDLAPGDHRAPTVGERRFLVAYMAVWAASLAFLWSIPALRFGWTGDPPDLNGSVHAFRVTAGLDLSLVVPYVLLAVVLLLRRSPWAAPVAAILNVKGVLYPMVLVASSVAAGRAGVDGAWTLVPLWTAFVVASGTACWMLLRPRGAA